jgi:hypothetical protein
MMNSSAIRFGVTNTIAFEKKYTQTVADAAVMEALVELLNKMGIPDTVEVKWAAYQGYKESEPRSLDPEDEKKYIGQEVYGVSVGKTGEEGNVVMSFSRDALHKYSGGVISSVLAGIYRLAKDGKLD